MSLRIAGILLAVLIFVSPIPADESAIRIAIPSDNLTHEERAPLQEYLSSQMARPVAFVIPGSYKEMIEGLASGSTDFALLGGLSYLQAHAKAGAIALVQRASDKQFHSVFIAGVNSSIQSLADLKGKSFAFGDVNSTSGHLIPYLELKQAGIILDKDMRTRYSGSHPATAALVESGAVDAGALDETFYKSLVESGKIDAKKVRVFHTSRPFVDWVFAARKGTSAAEQEKFSRALLSLKKGTDDRVLKVLRAEQFVRANDEEYVSLRQIARELGLL